MIWLNLGFSDFNIMLNYSLVKLILVVNYILRCFENERIKKYYRLKLFILLIWIFFVVIWLIFMIFNCDYKLIFVICVEIIVIYNIK